MSDEETPTCDLSAGDTAFMMFAATVVMMQTPAMGLAQAGMIRRKNSLSMLMQVLFGMVIGSLLWTAVGFSVAFGPSVGLFGNPFYYSFLRNVPGDDCLPELADTIPGTLFAAFQMMFALMAPLIVTGSWAEKMSFEAFLIFIVLWPLLVYYPLVHWVWNPEGWLNQLGVMDFAGGLVIHSSTGVAGFVVSVLLQRRKLHSLALAHHNLPLSFVGAALVWSGWYSFNAGSAYRADTQAAVALYNTHISACSGSLAWSLLSYKESGHWSMLECIGGAFAGLGGITAASGFVYPWAALVIGIIAGVAGHYSVRFFKNYLNLDDVLDVTSLQGTPGVLGSILVGLFASSDVSDDPSHDGLFYGGSPKLLLVQLLACAVVLAWSGCWTFAIVSFMKHYVGIDVSPDVEELGLDLVQIGEQAYDQRLDLLRDIGSDALAGLLNQACVAGDIEELKHLIRHGADLDGRDYDQRAPVHLAAAHGRNAVLDFLFTQHRVDLEAEDNFGTTPILDAIHHNRRETVLWLRQRGVDLSVDGVGGEQTKSEVFRICSKGDAAKLSSYIEAGLNFDFADYDLRTPLMIAASDGNEAVVRELLKAGADPLLKDRWDNTAVECASDAGHVEVVKLFVGDSEVVGPGLSRANERTPLMGGRRRESLMAMMKEKYSSVQAMTSGRTTDQWARVMCSAAAEGNVDELQRLIHKSVDVNCSDYDGRTPLHITSAQGHFEAVEFLLSQPRINVNAMDGWRHTPLKDAVRNGHNRVATLLRSKGAVSINRDLGYRLCSAAAAGKTDELINLLREGANLNAADYDARTALHLGASNGRLQVVKFLLTNGASASPKDRYGNSPLDDAKREGHQEVVTYLEEWVKHDAEGDQLDRQNSAVGFI